MLWFKSDKKARPAYRKYNGNGYDIRSGPDKIITNIDRLVFGFANLNAM